MFREECRGRWRERGREGWIEGGREGVRMIPPGDPSPPPTLQIAPSVGGSLHGSWNPPWTSGIIALVVIVAVLAGILLEGLMLSHRYECPHMCGSRG